jgi:hypothetical protein
MFLFIAFLSLSFLVGLLTTSRPTRQRALLLFGLGLLLSFAYFALNML